MERLGGKRVYVDKYVGMICSCQTYLFISLPVEFGDSKT